MVNSAKYINKLADTLRRYKTLDDITINEMLPNVELIVRKKEIYSFVKAIHQKIIIILLKDVLGNI